MPTPGPDSAAALQQSVARGARAAEAAEAVLAVFDAYTAQFGLVTRRAEARFIHGDWRGAQQDATERLTLYRQFVNWIVQDLKRSLGSERGDPELWRAIRACYSGDAVAQPDAELALTFFNSVARQVVRAAGPLSGVYFEDRDFRALPAATASQVLRTYPVEPSELGLEHALARLLDDLPFAARLRDRAEDARLVASAIARDTDRQAGVRVTALDMVAAPFYRNKGAYLVGRLRTPAGVLPLVLPLVYGPAGIEVDAVLTTADEASIVFSFTRSYFHVELERPSAMVGFLRTLMPQKPVDELYTSLGYHKHGKTELVRTLLRHLESPEARFEVAPGDKGLVMSVFALPSLNVVFKIIKDRFGAPKTTTRQEVMNKYHLVFLRDRVGRLADAQEFEDLEFAVGTFAPGLLEELMTDAAGSVLVDGDRVRIRHLYTERRVTPLNLFLREAGEEEGLEAVLDYGQAIKDLAAANIFTGDMLLKNFGVTRHGRVIFYDYDELCLLTECNFREIPRARTEEDELAAEPWFHVGERDVFPEEFRSFLALPGKFGEAFMRVHADLLTVDFWRRMQDLAREGEVIDFFPYRSARRLRH
jgi:isocitrate dehydrogenase kinase/phosphatase